MDTKNRSDAYRNSGTSRGVRDKTEKGGPTVRRFFPGGFGKGFPIGWVVAAVGAVGAALSLSGAYVAEDSYDKTHRLQFERIAHSYSAALEAGIRANLNELHALTSFYDSSNEITREEFRSFVSSILDRHGRTIQAIQWVPRVRDEERDWFVASVRADGLTNFRIFEWQAGERVTAGYRPEYYPVLYTEPFARSESTIGFNLASDAAFEETLARSGDSGAMQATGVVSPAEGGAFEDAFLVFRPLYRKDRELATVGLRRENLTGFAVGIFRIGEIVARSTNLEIEDPIVPHLHVFVYDRTSPDGPRLLYPEASPAGAIGSHPAHWRYGREIEVAGRTWLIDFRLDPDSRAMPERWIFWGVLLAGLAVTGMLVALLVLMNHATRESVRAANAIRESEERFRDFAATAADMFWETDENHRIVYVSSSAAGQPPGPDDRRGGAGRRDRRALDDPEKVLEKVSSFLDTREPFRDLEYPVVHDRDGEACFVQNSGKPIFDMEGVFKGYRGTAVDISEQKHRELQLRHFQKMEAVGQVTGGLAHDLNNVLSIISMNVSLLKEAGLDSAQAGTCIETAMTGITRAADLTRKLLDFSRKDAGETRRVSVNEFIRGMESLIAKSLTPKISLRTDLAEDAWLVEIDAGSFEDAILNLALNARDAMPDGGSLIIETANKVVDEGYAYRNPGSSAGDFVMIAVSDTGTGMTAETAQKAFEPFFTTKEVGQGTGLGLSMVYGFVQRSGGHAKIYSELGAGTTIRLYLPRASGKREVADDRTPDDAVLPRGDETVLVVDDEADLVRAAVSFLQSLGYRTVTAHTGREAQAALRENPAIDLLFSDVIMPGDLDGYALALEALKERPDLKVLLTSGFTRMREQYANGEHKIVSALAKSLLHKPYNIAELAHAVRRTLDGAG